MSQKEKKIQPKNTISSQLGYESDRQQPTEWKGMSRQQPDLQSREYHAISFHFIHHLQINWRNYDWRQIGTDKRKLHPITWLIYPRNTNTVTRQNELITNICERRWLGNSWPKHLAAEWATLHPLTEGAGVRRAESHHSVTKVWRAPKIPNGNQITIIVIVQTVRPGDAKKGLGKRG